MHRSRARAVFMSLPLCLLLAGPSWSHQADLVYPIFEVPSADIPNLHDGTLDDWEAVLPNASLTHNDLLQYGNLEGESIDPENLAFRAFLAWNFSTQKLYIGTERLDDVYLTPDQGARGDGYIRIMIDGDHSGGQYWYFESNGHSESVFRNETNRHAQVFEISHELDGYELDIFDFQEWIIQPPYADFGTFELEGLPYYSVAEVEFAPWDDINWESPEQSRRSSLRPGAFIGINLQVVDLDVPDRLSAWYTMALSTVVVDTHSGTADNLADGELIPCHVGDCSRGVTAVSSDSWARIKSSLR